MTSAGRHGAAVLGRATGLLLAGLVAASATGAAPTRSAPGRGSPAATGRAAAQAAREDSLYALWRPLLAGTITLGGQPRDVYKLLYQGIMGPAHAVADRARVLSDLLAECDLIQVEEAPDTAWRTPVLEPVRPDSQLVRVNLRPLLRRIELSVPRDQQAPEKEGELEALTTAFSRTASTWHGDPLLVRGLWRRAVADEALWTDRLQRDAAAALTTQLARAGWPAAHHSEDWTRRYLPHYRVVARALVPAAWGWPIAPLRPDADHAPDSERPRRSDLGGARGH